MGYNDRWPIHHAIKSWWKGLWSPGVHPTDDEGNTLVENDRVKTISELQDIETLPKGLAHTEIFYDKLEDHDLADDLITIMEPCAIESLIFYTDEHGSLARVMGYGPGGEVHDGETNQVWDFSDKDWDYARPSTLNDYDNNKAQYWELIHYDSENDEYAAQLRPDELPLYYPHGFRFDASTAGSTGYLAYNLKVVVFSEMD